MTSQLDRILERLRTNVETVEDYNTRATLRGLLRCIELLKKEKEDGR